MITSTLYVEVYTHPKSGLHLLMLVQDYTNERLHAVRIKTLPPGNVKFEVCSYTVLSCCMYMLILPAPILSKFLTNELTATTRTL